MIRVFAGCTGHCVAAVVFWFIYAWWPLSSLNIGRIHSSFKGFLLDFVFDIFSGLTKPM